MELVVAPEVRGPLLYVMVSGTPRMGRAEELYQGLLDMCARAGLGSVLLDCRGLEQSPSDTERYTLATRIARLNTELVQRGGRPPRIAVVAEAPVFSPARMLENAAVNRGVSLHSTISIAEAIEWLGLDPRLEELRTLS